MDSQKFFQGSSQQHETIMRMIRQQNEELQSIQQQNEMILQINEELRAENAELQRQILELQRTPQRNSRIPQVCPEIERPPDEEKDTFGCCAFCSQIFRYMFPKSVDGNVINGDRGQSNQCIEQRSRQ